jgi:hypothetical protein
VYRPGGIDVDGDISEWEGSTMLYDSENGVKIGVLNDEDCIYVSAVIWGEAVKRKVMAGGMTLWIKDASEDDHILGINYPMGMARSSREKGFRNGMESEGNMRESESQKVKDKRGGMLEDFVGDSNEVRFLGRGGEEKLLCVLPEIERKTGIALSLKEKRRSIIYEAKIPYRSEAGFKYSISQGNSGELDLTLETGKVETRAGASGKGPGWEEKGGGMPPWRRFKPISRRREGRDAGRWNGRDAGRRNGRERRRSGYGPV